MRRFLRSGFVDAESVRQWTSRAMVATWNTKAERPLTSAPDLLKRQGDAAGGDQNPTIDSSSISGALSHNPATA